MAFTLRLSEEEEEQVKRLQINSEIKTQAGAIKKMIAEHGELTRLCKELKNDLKDKNGRLEVKKRKEEDLKKCLKDLIEFSNSNKL
jgi:hemerythrin-like domain-containing protein